MSSQIPDRGPSSDVKILRAGTVIAPTAFRPCKNLQYVRFQSSEVILLKVTKVKMMRSSLRSAKGLLRVSRAIAFPASRSLSTTANSITLDLGNVFSTHCK